MSVNLIEMVGVAAGGLTALLVVARVLLEFALSD